MTSRRNRALRKPPVRVVDPDPEDLGPAMLALNAAQRRFVVAYAMNGNGTAAAIAAGYSNASEGAKVQAFRLFQMEKVNAALKEWTERALHGNGAFVAVTALIEIAGDPEHHKRFEAADSLADRVGFARQTNHQVSVEHVDSRSTGDLLEAIGRYVEAKRGAFPVKQLEKADVEQAVEADGHTIHNDGS